MPPIGAGGRKRPPWSKSPSIGEEKSIKLSFSDPFAHRGGRQGVSRARRKKLPSRDQGREMEVTHKSLGHVQSGAPPTRGPRKAHPTQVLRLGFMEWVPRDPIAEIHPLPTLPRGDGLAAEKGSLGGSLLRSGLRGTHIAVWRGASRPDANKPRGESTPPICPVTTPRKGQQVRDAPEPDGTFLGRWGFQARDTDKHP